jgi:hypothetical protein
MARTERIIVLIIASLVIGLLTIEYANSIISSITDYTAKATIVAATITVLGVIFSAMYNEISSYYKDRSIIVDKKWELIYPLVKKHYYPWINAAKKLQSVFHENINNDSVIQENQTRMLYLITIFYGYRIRFINEDGGLILLYSSKDGEGVDQAYRQVENALRWKGDETPRRVSYLQNIFMENDKPGSPYFFTAFSDDLSNDQTLQELRDSLGHWLNKENVQNADNALQTFIRTFESSIDKLYSAWEK